MNAITEAFPYLKVYMGLSLGLGAILVILALTGVEVTDPPAWLFDWTDWLATFAGICVGAKALREIPSAIAVRLTKS